MTALVRSTPSGHKPYRRPPRFFAEMKAALLDRLEDLRDAYAEMKLLILRGAVAHTIESVKASTYPEAVSTVAIGLARAVEASCNTPAAALADGLFEIGYAFGSLADGIAERQPLNWRRGCCRQAIDAAREMAERYAAEAPS